jgi:hypothetical protein
MNLEVIVASRSIKFIVLPTFLLLDVADLSASRRIRLTSKAESANIGQLFAMRSATARLSV